MANFDSATDDAAFLPEDYARLADILEKSRHPFVPPWGQIIIAALRIAATANPAGITPGVGRDEKAASVRPDTLMLRLEWKPDPIRPTERVLLLGPIEVGRAFMRGWGDGGQWVAWIAPDFEQVTEREGFPTLELAMEAVEELVREVCDDGSAAHEPLGEARDDPMDERTEVVF